LSIGQVDRLEWSVFLGRIYAHLGIPWDLCFVAVEGDVQSSRRAVAGQTRRPQRSRSASPPSGKGGKASVRNKIALRKNMSGCRGTITKPLIWNRGKWGVAPQGRR
jgi:hypothetical protein